MDRSQDEMRDRARHGVGGFEEGTDSAQIKRDIDRTRAEMDETIDELSCRLQPRNLLDRAMSSFGHRREQSQPAGGGGQFSETAGKVAQQAGHVANVAGRKFGRHVRKNPLPYAVIAGGIALLIYNQQKKQPSGRTVIYAKDVPDYAHQGPSMGERARGAMSQVRQRASETMHSVRERIRGTTAPMGERLSHAGESARASASHMGETARHRADEMRARAGAMASRAGESLRHGYDASRRQVRQKANQFPLTFGLLAMTAGMLAGFALPHTRKEDEWMGEQSEDAKEYARDTGHDLMERGKHAARSTFDAAADEARKQGLTPSQLREKAEAVAEETKEAAQHAASEEGHELREQAETAGEMAGQPYQPRAEKSRMEHTDERINEAERRRPEEPPTTI